MKDILIAAVIFHSPVGEIQKNLDRMAGWVRRACQQGVSIVCFPEMSVTGYSSNPSIREAAEPADGPVVRFLQDLAASEKVVILGGMVERDKGGKIFACHLVVRPDGPVQAYRKLHIAPMETEVFSPGESVPVFEAAGSAFGIQLCYDAHFPGLSTRMAQSGAEILFLPHASPRGTPEEKLRSWMRHLPARAYDNGVFVVAVNQTGENGRGLNFPGVAVILGPSGWLMKSESGGGESMLVADLKAEDLIAVRENRMRFFLPHGRPELYGG